MSHMNKALNRYLQLKHLYLHIYVPQNFCHLKSALKRLRNLDVRYPVFTIKACSEKPQKVHFASERVRTL